MIIQEVKANNRQHCFQIKTRRGEFSFPFIKLKLVPSSTNRIKDVYVDREAGKQAITYVLFSPEIRIPSTWTTFCTTTGIPITCGI